MPPTACQTRMVCAESRGTVDSSKRQIPPAAVLGRVLCTLHPESAKSAVAGHSTRGMQQLCEVSVEAYLAADNPFDVVSQPEVCARCLARDCFHHHGVYWRYVVETPRKVARC